MLFPPDATCFKTQYHIKALLLVSVIQTALLFVSNMNLLICFHKWIPLGVLIPIYDTLHSLISKVNKSTILVHNTTLYFSYSNIWIKQLNGVMQVCDFLFKCNKDTTVLHEATDIWIQFSGLAASPLLTLEILQSCTKPSIQTFKSEASLQWWHTI